MSYGSALDKLAARQKQKFLLLLNRDDFQHSILQLRTKWSIPKAGLNSAEAQEAWWHKHENNADEYEDTHFKANQEELAAAEQDWRVKKITARELTASKEAVRRRNPINGFYHDISQLIIMYRLSPRWKDALQAYLLTNEAVYKGPLGITIQSSFGREGDPDEISLKLDAHTTRQDLIDAWPSIKFHLDKLRHKTKAKTQPFDDEKLARNKLAYELRLQNKKYKEIAEVLNEKYGTAHAYGDIPTMIKNYKKLLGMN